MIKVKLLAAAALSVVLLVLLCASSAYATDSTSFSLALSTNQIQYKIPAGTTFNGTIATTGMVRFWATGPNGTQIINLGIVDKTTPFSFTAQNNGTYTFNFENDLPKTVTVTFTYATDPPLPSTSSGLPIYLIAVVAVAVAGSLLIVFVIRRKNKKIAEWQAKESSKKTR